MSKRRKSDTGVDADEEAKLQPQTKHVITALSLRLAGVGQLMQLNTFRSHLNECGFPVPETTLSTWRRLLPEDPDLFIPKQISGRPRSLTYEDEQLLGGFILHQNAMVRQVTYATVHAFLRAELNVETSRPTVISYVHAGGFSEQVAKVRAANDARVSHHNKLALGLEFIDELKEQGFFDTPLHRMHCIDATHTSHGKVKYTTIAPTGGCVFFSFCCFCLSILFNYDVCVVMFLQWRYAVHWCVYPRIHQCHHQLHLC